MMQWGAVLRGAVLQGAVLQGAVLQGVVPPGVVLQGVVPWVAVPQRASQVEGRCSSRIAGEEANRKDLTTQPRLRPTPSHLTPTAL